VFQGVTASEVYRTMLDPLKHGKMIGAEVLCDPRIGGRFSVGGGLIEGRILELEQGREIVLAWKTADWPGNAEPSRLKWRFAPAEYGARVSISHTRLPADSHEAMTQEWTTRYWASMERYFRERFQRAC
jgi:activator of HSP90 ATPase